jgi:hypothetical protein
MGKPALHSYKIIIKNRYFRGIMDYSGKKILGNKEDQTTDFKSEYIPTEKKNKEDIAQDICSFANGLMISHIYIGINCKEEKGSPGIAVSINKISEEDFTSIKQSIEDIANNRIYPTPELNIHYDGGFIMISINPTHELCEILKIKQNQERYETWIRKNHKNVYATNKEKDDIKRKKMVFRGLDIINIFDDFLTGKKIFYREVINLFSPELDDAIKQALFIESIDNNKVTHILLYWSRIKEMIKSNPHKDVRSEQELVDYLRSLIDWYSVLLS